MGTVRSLSLVLAVLLPSGGFAQSRDFMEAMTAYDAADPARCAEILLAMEAERTPVPRNGELLAAECLAQAGRFDEAFAFLRRQLPTGRIPFADLRDKSKPGLDALRLQPGWASLLEEARDRERARADAIDASLRDELLARASRDQAARRDALTATDGDHDPAGARAVAMIDRDNTQWLKEIVQARGWPGADRVGPDGARAAFLLVQHADQDPAFQAIALEHMARAVDDGNADPADFALLTDRVLLAQGKPQRYGSQFETGPDGHMRMRAAEDEAGLDARRRTMGLPPMADYRRMLQDTYARPVD